MLMAARIAAGVVLLLSGASKLAQPAWPATAAAFGAPRVLVPVLPWAELVLGAMLTAGVALPWTAWAATALLAAFTGAIAVRLRRGDEVPCGCFGEASTKPVGRDSLLRNVLLCGLAALGATSEGGGPAAVVAGVAIALLVLAQSWARAGARR